MHLVHGLITEFMDIYELFLQLPITPTTGSHEGNTSVNSQQFLKKGENLGTLKISVFLEIRVF